jgi:hypothetical protein
VHREFDARGERNEKKAGDEIWLREAGMPEHRDKVTRTNDE